MKSEACQSSTEIKLQASPGLGLALVLASLLAAGSAWSNALPLMFRLVTLGVIAVGGVVAVMAVMRPRLSLRIADHGLQYRAAPGRSWTTLPPNTYCFASPWYVGWVGRGWRGYGVFRSQLPPRQFRHLLVALRNRRSD
ncbi:MAG: hypothetical protein ACXIUM_09030 [Wenzhouxiangella sp.]